MRHRLKQSFTLEPTTITTKESRDVAEKAGGLDLQNAMSTQITQPDIMSM